MYSLQRFHRKKNRPTERRIKNRPIERTNRPTERIISSTRALIFRSISAAATLSLLESFVCVDEVEFLSFGLEAWFILIANDNISFFDP